MGSIKAYVGNLKKVDSENEMTFEGIGLYDGQAGEGTFAWETEPVALNANLVTVNGVIQDAIIAGSEAAGNSFNPMTNSVMIAGGPSLL